MDPRTPDLLSDVFDALEIDSRVWFRATLDGAFGVEVPAAEHATAIRFHVVRDGTPWIRVGERIARVRPGDLVLVPHGAPHVIRDGPGEETLPLAQLLAAHPETRSGWLARPGDGPRTRLVCGEFVLTAEHPFLARLPGLVHRQGGRGENFDWIEPLLRHLDARSGQRHLGSDAALRRLCEILLIEAMRPSDPGHDLVPALADDALRRAIEAIHEAPERDWTVAQLARIAGQSRTVFAERFRSVLGISPMRYLGAWRMLRARQLLGDPQLPIAEVARRVGYASDSAFHRSFREETGLSPGRFRSERLVPRA